MITDFRSLQEQALMRFAAVPILFSLILLVIGGGSAASAGPKPDRVPSGLLKAVPESDRTCGTLVKTPPTQPNPVANPQPGVDNGPQCPPVRGRREVCNTCGMRDSYTLAMNWQPAFCQVRQYDRSKPECRETDPKATQARNFSLHGLWPNRRACGARYEFCGSVVRAEQNFRSYPEVRLAPATAAALADVMPSVGARSGLERHEWHKHGTCSGFTPDAYFKLGTDLVREFNAAGMGAYMTRNAGREVSVTEFLDAVDQALGAGARDRISLVCNGDGNLLVEVKLALPADTLPGIPLKTLVSKAKPGGGIQNCRRRLTIDPIGF